MCATWYSVSRSDPWWPEFERRVVTDTLDWMDPRGLLEDSSLRGFLLLAPADPIPQVVGHMALTVSSDGYNTHVWGQQVRIEGRQPGAWRAGWALVDEVARQVGARYVLSITGRDSRAFARANAGQVMGTLIRRAVMPFQLRRE